MGHESLVYGCIVGSGWKIHDQERLHHANAAVIESLPQDDEWPFLTRAMFAFPPVARGAVEGRYKSLPIHFGATLKAVEWDWENWLDKFESVLGQLFWAEAFLHLRTEGTVGNYDYAYSIINWDSHMANPPTPASSWKMSGGPRRFAESGADENAATSWVFQHGLWSPTG